MSFHTERYPQRKEYTILSSISVIFMIFILIVAFFYQLIVVLLFSSLLIFTLVSGIFTYRFFNFLKIKEELARVGKVSEKISEEEKRMKVLKARFFFFLLLSTPLVMMLFLDPITWTSLVVGLMGGVSLGNLSFSLYVRAWEHRNNLTLYRYVQDVGKGLIEQGIIAYRKRKK